MKQLDFQKSEYVYQELPRLKKTASASKQKVEES